ncbi:hypothetical protein JQU17_08525 [Ponticoccus sp. SC2-23]|uniref:hypothetical protein n=1 Tax=Alexandriicola marinus TaxID=2081710 RepID=UPI000FD779E4|nr:hypothetical protein [Alexandriicola marinus]MBM1220269.1 hypothetical protein [Ponticoccus sp. SC6-9]MBM1224955.1 hypothetical protein [Ponticoccus sp. SC6-15]MBM1228469.1 hypothetical protein [Ponticoccus sp. SC6-38]MBM1233894.1 hypothetical protein [Ponticoccus sp. SC6-45]MBM1238970.1 hypothetical protein [Ponticoccus sp. SC6-49]MBM1242752.1 hypothetical protein [Ponticoccus sp. SC2-64]MBM1247418.1 hypothetical protein [Ponticoccus sp. SC6-42]MBM1251923.1 hypothetical protein [Pontico
MSGLFQFTAAYLPWAVWIAVMVSLGWRIPAAVAATERPGRDAGRRFAYGAVALTLVSLPLVYLIASLQASVFGGEGARWAGPEVLLATVVIIAPAVYIPVLTVRCAQLWLRERGAGD